MKIAIPCFGSEIAPWFDVATHIGLYSINNEQSRLEDLLVCTGCQGIDRVRRLQESGIHILMCAGISNPAKHMLQSGGMTVINRVTGPVEQALRAFIQGELSGADGEPIYQILEQNPTLKELVERTRSLFANSGYQVHNAGEQVPFPIDLVAHFVCPLCGKTIRAAICCGMHSYRLDEEIRAFHYATVGAYEVAIYIHVGSAEIIKTCQEFGLQLLNPALFEARISAPPKSEPESNRPGVFPLLERPLLAHVNCKIPGEFSAAS